MGRRDPTHLAVGYLTRPHGTKGEMLVTLLTDHPEDAFAPGVVLSLGDPEDDGPNPDLPPLRVESARPFAKGLLVTFGGIDDRTQAERQRARYLYLPIEQLPPLEEGEVFYHQLLGLKVVTVDGDEVGEVAEVYELAPADLLEVHRPGGVVMIPYRPEIIVELDLEHRRLIVDPPEGLLEL